MSTPTVAHMFSRDSTDSAVLVVDGFGVGLSVTRGHLLVRDGLGKHRRERTLPKTQRTVRRIVILGHTGQITLDAIRFCSDTGITLVQLDTDGPVLLIAGACGPDDARLRRAQAAAAGSDVGVDLARTLLTHKIRGQARVAGTHLQQPQLATSLGALADQLADADLVRARELEAQASNQYFAGWSAVPCRFAARDRERVPEAWQYFAARGSPLNRGRSPRNAADPVNALLNYGFALAETECRIASIAVGLDPGLGISHTDKKARDSLVLDLLEPLRPVVETHVLELLRTRYFRASDFHETRQGACRILPPLTHELTEQLPTYARAVAPLAEAVAHTLAGSSPGRIDLRTPLTRSNTMRAQEPGARSARRASSWEAPAPSATCRNCGAALASSRRQLCPACWPVTRTAIATEATRQRVGKLAELRRDGVDPTNTAEARAKRSSALSVRRREQLAWERAHDAEDGNRLAFEAISATLHGVPLSQLQQATGLSLSACSRIRSGKLTPHTRHWPALASCGAPSNEH